MSQQIIAENSMSRTKQYYALLVGIDSYPPPISALTGCIKDLNKIEHYLHSYIATSQESSESLTTSGLSIRSFGNLHICRLENAQATYVNMVLGFREHLQHAKADDVVWFHFSGHGAEQYTAEEFLTLEPNGKDQTLVCYQDDPTSQFHLADKELAILLHEVKLSQGNEVTNKNQIIVSLDCCHSGSGTRDFEFVKDLKSRKADLDLPRSRAIAAQSENGIRSIDSYIGDYSTQWQKNKQIQIPLTSHVLLSACESVQLAGDLPRGGVFTSGLIDALTAANGELNYSDLYIRTRTAVQQIRKKEQTPQFETIGEFDPFTRFLEGSPLGSPIYHEIFKEGNHWFVKCGAIHGIPLTSKNPTQLEIRTATRENTLLGLAELTSVGAQQSAIQVRGDLILQPDQNYQALIKYLPAPPMLIYVHGEAQGVDLLESVWDTFKNIQLIKSLDEIGEAQLEVEVTAEVYKISDHRTGQVAIEWPRRLDNANYSVIDMLGKMVNWERTISLQNEKSAIKNWFDFEIDLVKDPRHPFMTICEPETIIEANSTNFIEKDGSLLIGFIPYFKSDEKPNQNLYIYLLHLRSNYAISCYEGEVVYRVEEHQYNRSLKIPLLKTIKGWGLGPKENETTSYFKLFVTTEALPYQQLLQSELGGDRSAELSAWNPFSVENDWYSVTLKVVLERSDES
jgi:hypothetical protein